jgi:hypothetical protein
VPLREEDGLRLTKLLLQRCKAEVIHVSIRNDVWFIGGKSFPFYFRFDRELTPPTHDEYYSSDEVSCRTDYAQTRCLKFHPVDELGKRPRLKSK